MSEEKVHCTDWIGVWLGHRVGLGGVEDLAKSQTRILHSPVICQIFFSPYIVTILS